MIIDKKDNVEIGADGHKYARLDIPAGERVIKYGFPIGVAACDIKAGEKVYENNLRSALFGVSEWEYGGGVAEPFAFEEGYFMGYPRKDGSVGIRNELWIVTTVGCINHTVRTLASRHGARALTHPYGCSQLGGDLETTQKTLCGLIKHSNAGGVLVLGLGCEENGIADMQKLLGDYDGERIRFLNTQDCRDEIAEADKIIAELKEIMKKDKREKVPMSKLCVAVKCGGSDGYSGITANAQVGRISDRLYKYGATILMSEIPETFGAEQILLERARDRQAFDSVSKMMQDFRRYYIDKGLPINENPSPGNVAGGITTLEEKSLGCVQKAGKVTLCGVLYTGQRPDGAGLYMVNGPGNDMVAITNLTACGAHMILFTTGRGTPLSAPVPTLKIATNTALATKKKHWIDHDSMAESDDALFDLCIQTAEGRQTRAEEGGCYDIAIFKDGVTL